MEIPKATEIHSGEATEHVHQRRFSGAGRPHDGNHFPLFNCDCHISTDVRMMRATAFIRVARDVRGTGAFNSIELNEAILHLGRAPWSWRVDLRRFDREPQQTR
jgi:hypothetical protein